MEPPFSSGTNSNLFSFPSDPLFHGDAMQHSSSVTSSEGTFRGMPDSSVTQDVLKNSGDNRKKSQLSIFLKKQKQDSYSVKDKSGADDDDDATFVYNNVASPNWHPPMQTIESTVTDASNLGKKKETKGSWQQRTPVLPSSRGGNASHYGDRLQVLSSVSLNSDSRPPAMIVVGDQLWVGDSETFLNLYTISGCELVEQQSVESAFDITAMAAVRVRSRTVRPVTGFSSELPSSSSSITLDHSIPPLQEDLLLWCGRSDGSIVIVDAISLTDAGLISGAHNGPVVSMWSVGSSRDTARGTTCVWTFGCDYQLHVWDANSRRLLMRKQLATPLRQCCSISQEDGPAVWTCAGGNLVRVWDYQGTELSNSNFIVNTNAMKFSGEIITMRYNADSRTVWVCLGTGVVCVVALSTYTIVAEFNMYAAALEFFSTPLRQAIVLGEYCYYGDSRGLKEPIVNYETVLPLNLISIDLSSERSTLGVTKEMICVGQRLEYMSPFYEGWPGLLQMGNSGIFVFSHRESQCENSKWTISCADVRPYKDTVDGERHIAVHAQVPQGSSTRPNFQGAQRGSRVIQERGSGAYLRQLNARRLGTPMRTPSRSYVGADGLPRMQPGDSDNSTSFLMQPALRNVNEVALRLSAMRMSGAPASVASSILPTSRYGPFGYGYQHVDGHTSSVMDLAAAGGGSAAINSNSPLITSFSHAAEEAAKELTDISIRLRRIVNGLPLHQDVGRLYAFAQQHRISLMAELHSEGRETDISMLTKAMCEARNIAIPGVETSEARLIAEVIAYLAIENSMLKVQRSAILRGERVNSSGGFESTSTNRQAEFKALTENGFSKSEKNVPLNLSDLMDPQTILSFAYRNVEGDSTLSSSATFPTFPGSSTVSLSNTRPGARSANGELDSSGNVDEQHANNKSIMKHMQVVAEQEEHVRYRRVQAELEAYEMGVTQLATVFETGRDTLENMGIMQDLKTEIDNCLGVLKGKDNGEGKKIVSISERFNAASSAVAALLCLAPKITTEDVSRTAVEMKTLPVEPVGGPTDCSLTAYHSTDGTLSSRSYVGSFNQSMLTDDLSILTRDIACKSGATVSPPESLASKLKKSHTLGRDCSAAQTVLNVSRRHRFVQTTFRSLVKGIREEINSLERERISTEDLFQISYTASYTGLIDKLREKIKNSDFKSTNDSSQVERLFEAGQSVLRNIDITGYMLFVEVRLAAHIARLYFCETILAAADAVLQDLVEWARKSEEGGSLGDHEGPGGVTGGGRLNDNSRPQRPGLPRTEFLCLNVPFKGSDDIDVSRKCEELSKSAIIGSTSSFTSPMPDIEQTVLEIDRTALEFSEIIVSEEQILSNYCQHTSRCVECLAEAANVVCEFVSDTQQSEIENDNKCFAGRTLFSGFVELLVSTKKKEVNNTVQFSPQDLRIRRLPAVILWTQLWFRFIAEAVTAVSVTICAAAEGSVKLTGEHIMFVLDHLIHMLEEVDRYREDVLFPICRATLAALQISGATGGRNVVSEYANDNCSFTSRVVAGDLLDIIDSIFLAERDGSEEGGRAFGSKEYGKDGLEAGDNNIQVNTAHQTALALFFVRGVQNKCGFTEIVGSQQDGQGMNYQEKGTKKDESRDIMSVRTQDASTSLGLAELLAEQKDAKIINGPTCILTMNKLYGIIVNIIGRSSRCKKILQKIISTLSTMTTDPVTLQMHLPKDTALPTVSTEDLAVLNTIFKLQN